MSLPIIFTSCLPRSGSTLLQNLLGQNPKIHVTPTDDLIDLIVNVQQQWTGCESFKAQGIANVQPRIQLLLQAMIEGYHLIDFQKGKTVFNKSRGWIGYIELIEEILQRPIKIVVTVRDIRDICSSFELLNRKNNITKPFRTNEQIIFGTTIEDRCNQYLAKDATTGMFVQRLKNVFEQQLDNRLLIVPYYDLVNYPVETISRVHQECGLEPFEISTEVSKITYENDEVYGRPYHELRDNVDLQALNRWKTVLPNDVAEKLNEEYPGIQKLANYSYIEGRKINEDLIN